MLEMVLWVFIKPKYPVFATIIIHTFITMSPAKTAQFFLFFFVNFEKSQSVRRLFLKKYWKVKNYTPPSTL